MVTLRSGGGGEMLVDREFKLNVKPKETTNLGVVEIRALISKS